jgi:deazaflavin-dependent oxidoreductase (nitroreductase family)
MSAPGLISFDEETFSSKLTVPPPVPGAWLRAMNTYEPSPSDRVRDQVALYEATDGAQGNELEGAPVVILTTTGAKSGHVRKTPIIRMVDGDRFIAVASAGGAPRDPAWYHNLVADPVAEVQEGPVRRTVRAREVHGAEKDRLWTVAETFWPRFPQYRADAGREIPMFVLTPLEKEPS